MKTLYESILGSNNASLPREIHNLVEQFLSAGWKSYLYANRDANGDWPDMYNLSIKEIIYNISKNDFYTILKDKIDNLYHAKNKKDSSQYFIIFGKEKDSLFIRLRKVTKDFWYCSWREKEFNNRTDLNWKEDEYFFDFDHQISFFHRPKPEEISDELLKELRKQKFKL